MTQPLWYYRKNNVVKGPFPSPQIKEMLKVGELSPADLVSLDREQWISIARSGHFQPRPAPKPASTVKDEEWEQEREKARSRWLKEDGIEVADSIRLPEEEARKTAALAQDHAETMQMVQARASRRPPYVLGGVALLIVMVTGILVWHGQGDDTIRASFERVSNCALAPADGVSWAGCVRTGEILRGAVLRNADLSGGNYDNADLSAADLAYANLRRSSLRGANLRATKLTGAALDGADLTGADLTGADLSYATLTSAIVEGVRLDGAALGKATWTDGRVCDQASIMACR
jgi:hypothetical protein